MWHGIITLKMQRLTVMGLKVARNAVQDAAKFTITLSTSQKPSLDSNNGRAAVSGTTIPGSESKQEI